MIWKSSIVLLVRTSTSRLLNNFSGCPNSTIDTFLNGFTPGQLSQKSSNKCITSSISINNSVIRQSDYLQKIKNKTFLFDVFPWNQFHNSFWIFFFVKSISSLLFEFFFSVKSITGCWVAWPFSMTMIGSLPWVMTTTLDLGKGASQGKFAIFLAMAVKKKKFFF